MSFTLEPLQYPYDALEPVIDKETMEIHHDKHHQTYVNNLNKAIAGTDFDHMELNEILTSLDQAAPEKRNAIRNNAGGHANHVLFWESMVPGGSKEPVGKVKAAIEKKFGSFEAFKEAFEAKGTGQFGSGWAWLVEKDGEIDVLNTPNQNSPVTDGYTVLLLNDVWEHAYYLKHQNKRAAYLKAWWDVVNWDVVEKRFK